MSSAGWVEDSVDVSGLDIHYLRTGGPGPVVVLAHGVTESGACWTRVAQELEGDYDLVMPDARGHGGSGRPGRGYDYPTLAQDLLGLVKTLRLDHPVVVGHSMGGGAAATAAAAAASDSPFRALVLEDPPFGARGGWNASRRQRYAALQEQELSARQALSLERLIESGRTEIHPDWDAQEMAPWARAKLEVSREVLQLFTAPAPDPEELLPRIETPVLLLAGEPRLGSAMSAETVELCQKLIRRGRVQHIAGAGHNLRKEAFERFMEHLRAFLAEQTR